MKLNKRKRAPKPQISTEEVDEDVDMYQPSAKWYNEDVKVATVQPVTEQVLIELKEEAQKCHESEVTHYLSKTTKKDSNYQWMKTMMNKGTVSDRVAAHTVAIQDNPVCNLDTLRNMVNMVKVGKKKECFTVMETLTELFLNDLLRPDGKLQPFHRKPLSKLDELSSGNGVKRRQILARWYFEDELKQIYNTFVQALSHAAQDSVDTNKEKSITAMFKLLSGNPEQEQILLAYIVNKLGDPAQKVASKTIYCLTQLLFKHPNMQGVVLKEVEKLLFRSNINSRAQYYCLCFMSQFYLSVEGEEVAKKMVEVYLAFFKACVKKGEVDSRMMSALLMGLNRAYPYSKLTFEEMSEHVDTLYRLVHMTNFNVALQVLVLLFHVTGDKMQDRYYSALYKKLSDAKLLTSTHQAMLLSLLYKALKKDPQIDRVKVFIKRLLQIALFVQPNFACGILYLISQLITRNSKLESNNLIENYDDDEEKYYDIKDEEDEERIGDNEEPEKELLGQFNGDGWVHTTKKTVTKYNPLCRNPLFGGGGFLSYSELVQLKAHFHPTVALWSSNILDGQKVIYTGDPLNDFTLVRFLDRFVFKNPKSLEDKLGAHPTFGKRKFYKPKGLKRLPVNSKSYLQEDAGNIPVDELFLYSYLQRKQPDFKDEDQSDLESVASEEFEEMLDKMAGVSNEDDDDEEDYFGAIDSQKGKKSNSNEEELSDDDDEEAISDDEAAISEDEEAISDDDEEELEFLDSDSDSPKVKKAKRDVSSVFASAEEFASLLEEEGTSKKKPGSSSQMSNKDEASHKQLNWEEKRNHWIRGYNQAVGKKRSKK